MSSDSESASIHGEGDESDSDTYYTGEESTGDAEEKEGDCEESSEEEGDGRESSEDKQDADLSQLGETAAPIGSFTRTQTSQTVTMERGGQEEYYEEGSQTYPGTPVPSSYVNMGMENTTHHFPAGQVPIVNYNVTQNLHVQKCGDVNIGPTRNLNIGGTQNISSRSGPSQEPEEEKPLTAAQKIRKRTESKINDWNRGMVKTQSLLKVLHKIHKGATWVTVKGSPGEGKTTTAYMALEELYTEGKQVFQVISPEEYSEVIMTSSRPVIMLDDVFGDLKFDEAEWARWKTVLRQSLDITEHRSSDHEPLNKGPTVILTGRDYVCDSASSHMGRLSEFVTQEQYVVSMTHDVERELQEKLDIWNAIVKAKGIELDDNAISEICQIKSQHGFPHKCRLFAEHYQSNNIICAKDFFQCPIIFLSKTLVSLMKNTNMLTFFLYMIKKDASVSVRDLRCLTNGQELIQTAECLVGPYLKKTDDYFMFDHPSIYDCVSFILCESHPQFVIENCNLTFLHQRVRFHDQCCRSHRVAYIPTSYKEDLVKRFVAEIRKGNLFYVLSHDVCTNSMFVKDLISKVSLPFEKLFEVCDRKTGDPFLCLIASNKSHELLQYIYITKGWFSRKETHMILFGVCKFAAADALSYLHEVCGRLEINVQIKPLTQSPLMIAAKTRDGGFVHQMLVLNPDMTVRDKDHKTAFHYFCENGLESVVDELIQKRTVNINDVDRFNRSSLWFACVGNHLDVVKLLLKAGADTNQQTQDGFTPLHLAEKNGFKECADILLKAGADRNTRPHGVCPRPIPEETESTVCYDFLLKADYGVNEQNYAGDTLLHRAATSSRLEHLKTLLRRGAELNIQNKEGDTPLYKTMHSVDCMELLTEAGADVNVQNRKGETPLHSAASYLKKSVGVLLQAGADVNKQANDGSTPLHKAAGMASEECVDLLIKSGADVNARDGRDHTPLHSATMSRSKECTELLLKAGADVNARNDLGDTSLHEAAMNGFEKCADILLKAGANVNIANRSGRTPLHSVVRGPHSFDLMLSFDKSRIRICQSLIKHGVDVNQKDVDGNTPLHILCRDDNDRVCRDNYFANDSTKKEDYGAMVTLLVGNGADVNILNKEGKPALPHWCRPLLES